MISNGLFAAIADELVRLIQYGRGNRRQIRLDAGLVLGSRRYDAGCVDRAFGIELIPMPAEAAGRLGAAETGSSARSDGHRRKRRWLVGRDQPERLLAGVNDLERPHHDALERIAAQWAEPGLSGKGLNRRGKAVEIECVACERPDQIGATPLQQRMQRR